MAGLVEGKVVIITGAGSGVGHAATLLFARNGAKVLALDIDLASVEAVAEEARKEGGTVEFGKCDVSDAAQVDAAVADAVKKFGRLDIMYNNAGITTPPRADGGPIRFLDTDTAELDRLHKVNVKGVVNGCRAAIRQFKEQGNGGAIVNTASVVGLVGWGNVLYSATKGAVTSITRTLSLEVAPLDIRVNSVCPAGMITKFGIGSQGKLSPEIVDAVAKLHPLGRVIEPMDTANAALFLASDMASNITGVNLPVDGGVAAGKPNQQVYDD